MSARLMTTGALLIAVAALLIVSLSGVNGSDFLTSSLNVAYVAALAIMCTALMLTFFGLLRRPGR